MIGATAVVNVATGGVGVTFHCEQSEGRASYKVTHDDDGVTVYLTGTPADLGRFADAIVRAVSEHAVARDGQGAP